MLPLRATPARKSFVLALEEENQVHTIETTSPKYSEVETSPVPLTWGSESTPASPSPPSGISRHCFRPTHKIFALSVVPTMKGTNDLAQATNTASSPTSRMQLGTSPRASSAPPGSPSPVRSIIDFYLGHSPSLHRPTQYVTSDLTEREKGELNSDAEAPSPSLSSSQASELFCQSRTPARAYIEDFLATTDVDEDGDGDLRPVRTAPPIRDNGSVAPPNPISTSSRVVRVAVGNSPVVPEMWDDTSSSSSTSSTDVSDGFEKAEVSQQRLHSESTALIHLDSASPNSPLPTQLTASPTLWRRCTKDSLQREGNAAHVPQVSVSMIHEKHVTAPIPHTNAAPPVTPFAMDARTNLNRSSSCLSHRTGDVHHCEAVERVLRFPLYTEPVEGAHIDSAEVVNDVGEKVTQIACTTTLATPVISDEVVRYCSVEQRAHRLPFLAPPYSSPSPSHTLAPSSVDVEKCVTIQPPTSAGENSRSDSWCGGVGGSQNAARRAAETDVKWQAVAAAVAKPHVVGQGDTAQGTVYRLVDSNAASFPMDQRNPEPPLLRHAAKQTAASERPPLQSSSAKKPSVRSLLVRLYPGPSTPTHPGADHKIASHDKRYVSQIPQHTADPPPPRWNVSTKAHYSPLTEGTELAHAGKCHLRVRQGSRSLNSDDYISERIEGSHRRLSRSVPPKAPLHTRTSLLRLEATKTRKEAEAALREEIESPSFHPTVSPQSARICREKLRELKRSKGAVATVVMHGFQQEQASRTQHFKRNAKVRQGTFGQDVLWGDATVMAEVSLSSSDEPDALANAQVLHPSAPLVRRLSATQPPTPQVSESCEMSSTTGALVHTGTAVLRARQQTWPHQRLQAIKREEQSQMPMHHHSSASSSALRQSTDDPGCLEPLRLQPLSSTNHIDISTQCNLLPSECAAASTMTASPGKELQPSAIPSSAGAEDAPLLFDMPIETQTALHRVDFYSAALPDAPETHITLPERQQRMEDRLRELEMDRRRRLTMSSYHAQACGLAARQPLCKPFTGR
ncbi:hypothetical protein MNV84_03013 [Leishmania braziliensis]|nr:hypothetical protein MNV84_03013 [Leishmania braziliensis]